MARLVEADRLEAGSLPRSAGPPPDRRWLKRCLRARAEDKTTIASFACLVLDKRIAQRADDRDDPASGSALWLDLDSVLVVLLDCPAEDHAERHEGVADRRRVASLRKEVIRNPLNVAMLNVAEACSTEARNDVVAQRCLIAPDRAWFVGVPRAIAHATRPHAGDELLGGL
jgi:hypothetical protein